jgi:hypothetical protein
MNQATTTDKNAIVDSNWPYISRKRIQINLGLLFYKKKQKC